MKRPVAIKLTIASGQTRSTAFNIENCSIWGVLFPAAFDGTSVSFEAAGTTFTSPTQPDASEFKAVVDPAGGLLSISVAADRIVALDPTTPLAAALANAAWVRVVASVAQAADREILLLGTIDAS